ncbi:cytochrome P450, partial [Gyrodon lividus]
SLPGGSRVSPGYLTGRTLPYVEALIKETLRWQSPAPLGKHSHATVEDDVDEGYYIPKGCATVIANSWYVLQRYHLLVRSLNRLKFQPERCLSPENCSSIDELSFVFGFGCRVCVGGYVVDATLWITIVSMLAVFRCKPAPSWDGGPGGPNVQ